MAQSNETSWYGASIAVKTISIKTSAALGTLAEAMLAAVEVNLKNETCFLVDESKPTCFRGPQGQEMHFS